MGKVVYNDCYGGLALSEKATKRYRELGGVFPEFHSSICRHDPLLIQVVEELGEEAGGTYANLKIVELPSGTKYRIDEYGGYEGVETPESYFWEICP